MTKRASGLSSHHRRLLKPNPIKATTGVAPDVGQLSSIDPLRNESQRFEPVGQLGTIDLQTWVNGFPLTCDHRCLVDAGVIGVYFDCMRSSFFSIASRRSMILSNLASRSRSALLLERNCIAS